MGERHGRADGGDGQGEPWLTKCLCPCLENLGCLLELGRCLGTGIGRVGSDAVEQIIYSGSGRDGVELACSHVTTDAWHRITLAPSSPR